MNEGCDSTQQVSLSWTPLGCHWAVAGAASTGAKMTATSPARPAKRERGTAEGLAIGEIPRLGEGMSVASRPDRTQHLVSSLALTPVSARHFSEDTHPRGGADGADSGTVLTVSTALDSAASPVLLEAASGGVPIPPVRIEDGQGALIGTIAPRAQFDAMAV